MENLELLERAKRGDTQAFGQIYDLYADRIFKYIRFKIQALMQAEDILQEVFIRAWRGMPTLKITPEMNFQAWMYKIAQNTVNDHLRKIYRSPETQELDENLPVYQSGSFQEELDQKGDLKIIKEAFNLLPAQYKEILELRYIQDLNIDEVCKITGKTNLAVRLAQHRALKQLRKILGEHYVRGNE